MTVVLIGPHGVGKTTTGRRLSALLDVPFHPELGELLARRARPLGHTAADSQVAFDDELFTAELARDATWGGNRIVETWHPGNLAYAGRRSPEVVARTLDAVTASCRRGPTVVVPLVARRDTLAGRQHEPGPLEFFEAVGKDASIWAARLGLPILEPVSTDDDPEATALRVAALIQPYLEAA